MKNNKTHHIIFVVAIILMVLAFPISLFKTLGDYNVYDAVWSAFLQGENIWQNTNIPNAPYAPYGPFFAMLGFFNYLNPIVDLFYGQTSVPKMLFFACYQIIIFFLIRLCRLKNDVIGQIVVLVMMYAPMSILSQLIGGQLEFVIAFLLIMAFESWYQNKKITAALLLVLASVGIKITYVAIVPFLFFTVTASKQNKQKSTISVLNYLKNLIKNLRIEKKFVITFSVLSLVLMGGTILRYGNYVKEIFYFLSQYPVRPFSIFTLYPFASLHLESINQISFLLLASTHIVLFVLYIINKIERENAILVSLCLVISFHKVGHIHYALVPMTVFCYFLLRHIDAFNWKHILVRTLPLIGIFIITHYSAITYVEYYVKKIGELSTWLFQDSNTLLHVIRLEGFWIVVTLFACKIWFISSLVHSKSLRKLCASSFS